MKFIKKINVRINYKKNRYQFGLTFHTHETRITRLEKITKPSQPIQC